MSFKSHSAWDGGAVKAWGKHGVVTCSQPIVSQIGIDILQKGGNAMDAIIAMAAALSVTDPAMIGIGGGGFLIYYQAQTAQTKVLNFSEIIPYEATANLFQQKTGFLHGALACSVPGAPAGWLEAITKEGTMLPQDVLAPAIKLAREGFPFNSYNLIWLNYAYEKTNSEFKKIFNRERIKEGSIVSFPELANTLNMLATLGANYFYHGPIAKHITAYLKSYGGILSQDDFANYKVLWQDPIEIEITLANKKIKLQTAPPNSIGFQLLESIKLLEKYSLKNMGHNSVEYIHTLAEFFKFAAADRIQYAGDPAFAEIPVDRLLSDAHIHNLQKQFNPKKAKSGNCNKWKPNTRNYTSSLAVIDKWGNAASMTGTLAGIFGNGIMVPETGIILNGSMSLSDLYENCHTPNKVNGGHRPAHPISPALIFHGEDHTFWFSIATPGGFTLSQTTAQMILNIVVFGLNPQEAVEAPRFIVNEKTELTLEKDAVSEEVLQKLHQMGHSIKLIEGTLDCTAVGNGQIGMIDSATKSRLAGGDPRRGSQPLAY